MKRELFKTLFSRMLTTYLTVVLCLLLLVGVMVSSMFRNQYLEEGEETLRKAAATVNTILEEKYVHEARREVARQELLVVARQYDALIEIVTQQGDRAVFYDNEESDEKWGSHAEVYNRSNESGRVAVTLVGLIIYPGDMDNQFHRLSGRPKHFTLQWKDIQTLSEQGFFIYDIAKAHTDVPTLTIVRSFMNAGDVDGAIVMHMDMSSINTTISKVYMDVMLIGLIAVAAAVMVVYYLTTRITKPITDMGATIRQYSKGAFEIRIPVQGNDEVAQLAKSFNNMADAMNDLEQMRRSFVANVSHELRSPLTSISGFLEAIQDGTIPEEKQAQYIGIVVSETKRMTGMVNNLLDLARIESGTSGMNVCVFDINELAKRMILTFEARINAKSLSVELHLMEPNCRVEADVDQIGQVLHNLIDNAIKFSPEQGGRLFLQTKIHDRHTVSIAVEDNGVGIPAEDLRHVFDRFYKAEKAHTPSAHTGTGLGLSIVKVILDQHGQDISVKSAVGEGTRFEFTLRRAQDMRRRTESKPEDRTLNKI